MNLFKYTYSLVRQIPEGMVSSYGAVAKALGDIRASRAVGRMMNQNPHPDDMPCFKIVRSNGEIGGFGLGVEDKIRRLEKDDIQVENGEVVDFEKVFFDDFKTSYPLKKLREKQLSLKRKLDLKDDFDDIETAAGLDVAYPKNDFDKACAACVVMDFDSKDIIETKTFFTESFFPYIPTYLSYRELPLLKGVVKELDSLPSVFMLDGNGILHPFGFGLASHFGVEMELPSIGVAKSLLCGDIINDAVYVDDEKRGFAFFSSEKLKRPVYISPGHKIALNSSLEVTKNFGFYRVPEPVRQAHRLARKSIKSYYS
ncbi:MAG: endonuclease V [Candidatus Thermoplasmatota archaeon]